jgi:predicted ATPase
MTAWEATGAELWRPYYLALLAEVYGTMGQPERGLKVLAESLTVVEKNSERMWEAELYRLRGHLLLKQDHSNIVKAQSCFQRAIEIARRQSAKSLELRATVSLARMLAKQGQHADARTMLAEIYNWFTEGFGTADLKDAKALLDELAN